VAVARQAVELVRGQPARVLAEPLAEAESARDDRAARARDDVRADLRHPPLAEVRKAVVQRTRDRELEYRVTEELQALVRVRPVGGPARVREDCRAALLGQRGDQLCERLTGAT